MDRAVLEGHLWKAWLKTAKKNSSRIALWDESTGKAWTFRSLVEKIEEFARMIGFKRENQIIAFSLPNGAEWLALFLAIQKSQAIALPIDSTLSPKAQIHAARELGAHWLLESVGSSKERLSPIALAKGDRAWSACLAVVSERRRVKRGARAGSLGSPCLIKTTSGTTGKIKSIACSSQRLLADGRQIIKTMKIRPSDRNLAIIPLGHSYGLGNLVMPLILQGTSLVCVQGEDLAGKRVQGKDLDGRRVPMPVVPRQILELIQKHKITVLPAVPAIFHSLAQLEGHFRAPNSSLHISSLRLAISAGAPLSAEIAREFHEKFGILIHNFYGSSETGGICYDSTGRASLTGRAVGKPMKGVHVSIDKDGRIVVRSPAVASNVERRTSGVQTLPDMGEWNRYGELKITGRAGDAANLGGRKVHPAEIESCFRKLKGISDAWVGVLQDRRGDFLAAALETRRKPSKIETDFADFLPSWKLPKRWLLRSSLPRTSRGKLDVAEIKGEIGNLDRMTRILEEEGPSGAS